MHPTVLFVDVVEILTTSDLRYADNVRFEGHQASLTVADILKSLQHPSLHLDIASQPTVHTTKPTTQFTRLPSIAPSQLALLSPLSPMRRQDHSLLSPDYDTALSGLECDKPGSYAAAFSKIKHQALDSRSVREYRVSEGTFLEKRCCN